QRVQGFSGSRLGDIERALALDGENSLLDLVRQEPAASCKHNSRQEILAVHHERCGCVGAHSSSPSRKSSAAPRGPEARPGASRQGARRIARGSAPCWTANENAIAASRAAVSAFELLL